MFKLKKRFIWFISILVVYGCNPLKYVPEDQYYLDKITIETENKEVSKEELRRFIKQKSNKKIVGVKFHQWLYSLSNPNKDNKLNSYFRKIGEAPVIYDQESQRISQRQLEIYLDQQGYFDSEVTSYAKENKKHKKEVIYNIETEDPYKVQSISYNIQNVELKNIIFDDLKGSNIKMNKRLKFQDLISERLRLERLIKNHGYYYFSREDIDFEIDTTHKKKHVHIDLNVNSGALLTKSSTQYKINNVYFFRNYNVKKYLEDSTYLGNVDTSAYKGLYFLSKPGARTKMNILAELNYIKPGETYRIENAEITFRNLNSLKIFSNVTINFKEVQNARGESLLDCEILLSPFIRQSYQLEASATYTLGNIGAEGSLNYRNRDIFGNAEILDVSFRGGSENLFVQSNNNISNSNEWGIETRLSFPRSKFTLLNMIAPEDVAKFKRKYGPKTTISAAYTFRDRQDLFVQYVANASYGYTWKGNKNLTHFFNPIKLNYVNITDTTSRFNELIPNTTYYRSQYEDRLIPSISYGLLYTNPTSNNNESFQYIKVNIESSAFLLQQLFQNAGNQDKPYKILNTEFSQYISGDIDLRHYQILNPEQSIVYRTYVGVIFPYGNSSTVPVEKRYFIGGPNSLRAWRPFFLGPGSSALESQQVSRLTGSSDIKLEMNIEYRFDLFWKVEGAFFADAGNIWAIKGSPLPGSLFKINQFYREIALGSGFGIRFDFDYFIMRFDLGFQMYDPRDVIDTEGNPSISQQKWIFQKSGITQEDWAFQIGIAYPF